MKRMFFALYITAFTCVFRSDAPPALDRVAFGVSIKMKKLLSILGEIKQRPGVEKTVVISQFTSFLDILAGFLHKHGYESVRCKCLLGFRHAAQHLTR